MDFVLLGMDAKHQTSTTDTVSTNPCKDRLLPEDLGAPSTTAQHRRVHRGEPPNYEAVTESNIILPCKWLNTGDRDIIIP